jgi:hypothetical protein
LSCSRRTDPTTTNSKLANLNPYSKTAICLLDVKKQRCVVKSSLLFVMLLGPFVCCLLSVVCCQSSIFPPLPSPEKKKDDGIPLSLNSFLVISILFVLLSFFFFFWSFASLLCLVLSYLVVSCRVVLRFVLVSRVVSCLDVPLSCRVLLCNLSCLVVSYPVLSCLVYATCKIAQQLFLMVPIVNTPPPHSPGKKVNGTPI